MRESKTMKKITRSRIRKVRACNLISLSPSVADLSWGSFSIAAAAMVDFLKRDSDLERLIAERLEMKECCGIKGGGYL